MSIEEDDCDLGDPELIKNLFGKKCEQFEEKQIFSSNNYILHITGTDRSRNGNVAAATSDCYINFYNLLNSGLDKFDSLKQSDKIIGIEFSKENDNLIYIGSVNGKIDFCDLRKKDKVVLKFKDTSLGNTGYFRPLTCFDISPNSKLISAGTELYEGDAFILFWDTRNANLLGGYWESHKDEITKVKFHPEDSNKLSSGSTDGLINIYDLSQTSEDNALIETLNTESSVENIIWYKENKKDHIFCTTNTYDIQLWRMTDAELFETFSRQDITKAMQRKSEDYLYVGSAYKNSQNEVYVLAGSRWENSECARSLKVASNKLIPEYVLKGNEQIIRDSWYNAMENVLITGGERGILNAWKLA